MQYCVACCESSNHLTSQSSVCCFVVHPRVISLHKERSWFYGFTVFGFTVLRFTIAVRCHFPVRCNNGILWPRVKCSHTAHHNSCQRTKISNKHYLRRYSTGNAGSRLAATVSCLAFLLPAFVPCCCLPAFPRLSSPGTATLPPKGRGLCG